jgi:hypothetical protein
MAKLVGARGCGYVKSAEFIWNFNDTATDSVSNTTKTFGSVYTDAIVFDCINLPVGCQFLGGGLVVETQGAGPTAFTVALGTSAAPAQYLAATSLLTASGTRTDLPLLLSLLGGLGSNNGQNLRMTIASTVANATAGRFRINVTYKLDGQVMEATPS